LAAGCAAKSLYVQEMSSNPYGKVCSIAVLPLIDHSTFPQGEKLVYRVFLSEVSKFGTWRVALEGDVRKIYRQLHLNPWEKPTLGQLRLIASQLGVERIITGEIINMDERIKKYTVEPSLEMQVRMYDGGSGKLLLATYHRMTGEDYRVMMHIGRINSISGLVRKMMQEVLDLWKKNGLSSCAS
jgi:hypothetical protein